MELTIEQKRALALAAARKRSRGGQPSPAPKPEAPPTLQDRSDDIFGFKDYEYRGTILPFGRTKDGKTEIAWPQIAVDMAESAILPGHVVKGGSYTPEDAARFALDYAAPATAGKSAKVPKVSKREFIENAPSTEDLTTKGRTAFNDARTSGATLRPDKYVDFLADLETDLAAAGIDPMLHGKATAVFNAMSKRVGQAVDIGDLQTIRRQIGIAANSTAPELADERRIAGIMRDRLDDMIESLTDADLVAGTANGVSEKLKGARSLWSKAKKSETIEGIMEKAKDQASGFENGLRIGFRQLLNNKKAVRGFTPDEIAAMQEVVRGATGTKLMRILGKLSFGTKGGSNWLGGSVGMAGGQALGGPIGMAAAPTIGYIAQKGADAATRKSAEYARALAAMGGKAPPRPSREQQMYEMLLKGAGPAAGTMVPRQ